MIAYFRFALDTHGNLSWVSDKTPLDNFYLPVVYDYAPLANHFVFRRVALEYLFPFENIPMVCRLPDRIERPGKKGLATYKFEEQFSDDWYVLKPIFSHYKIFINAYR